MARLATAVLVLLVAVAAVSQAPQIASQTAFAEPVIGFTQDFPLSAPSHYSLQVTRSGQASYESVGKLTPEAEGDPFSYNFAISSATVTQLFALAEQAKYFERDVDYKKGRQANTGKKTLSYQDAARQHHTEYNYSTHQEIQQLTKLFQSIALTMEFARHLQYFHRYQPLALEEDLKRMEEMEKGNDLQELPAIAPILQQIADDKAVLNVSRSRALRLLSKR